MKTVHLAFVVALAACSQTEPVPVPVPVPVSAPDVPVVLSGDMESPPVPCLRQMEIGMNPSTPYAAGGAHDAVKLIARVARD